MQVSVQVTKNAGQSTRARDCNKMETKVKVPRAQAYVGVTELTEPLLYDCCQAPAAPGRALGRF